MPITMRVAVRTMRAHSKHTALRSGGAMRATTADGCPPGLDLSGVRTMSRNYFQGSVADGYEEHKGRANALRLELHPSVLPPASPAGVRLRVRMLPPTKRPRTSAASVESSTLEGGPAPAATAVWT